MHAESEDVPWGPVAGRRAVLQGVSAAALLAAIGVHVGPTSARAAADVWVNPMIGNHGGVGQRYRRPGDTGVGRIHYGYDIGTDGDENRRVHAASSGVVTLVQLDPVSSERGCYVLVDHGAGVRTLYQHLATGTKDPSRRVLVVPGQRVQPGEPLGTAGRTGTLKMDVHLHVEVFTAGPSTSISHGYTENPWPFFEARGVRLGDDPLPNHHPAPPGGPVDIEEDTMRLFETTTPWGEKVYGYTTATGGAGTLDANQYQHLVQFWPWVSVNFDAFQTETSHAWYRAGEAAKAYRQPAG